MSSIIEKIKKIDNLYHAKSCTTKQIKEAQKELGITFPDEYIDVLKEYGAISFFGTEWTGLNVDEYLDVVAVTKQEREINKAFPAGCFVLENQGVEGLIIIVDEAGQVYSLQSTKIEKIHENMSGYLDECIDRKK